MKDTKENITTLPAVTVKGMLEHDRRFVAVMDYATMNTVHGKVWRLVTDDGRVLQLDPAAKDGEAVSSLDLHRPPDRIESVWGGNSGMGSEFGWAIEETLSAPARLNLMRAEQWNAAWAAHVDTEAWRRENEFPAIAAFEKARKAAHRNRDTQWNSIGWDDPKFPMSDDVRELQEAAEQKIFKKAKALNESDEIKQERALIEKFREHQRAEHHKRIQAEKKEARKKLELELRDLWQSTAVGYGVKMNRIQAGRMMKAVRERAGDTGNVIVRHAFLVDMLKAFEEITGHDVRPAIRAQVLPDWPDIGVEWLAAFDVEKEDPDFVGTPFQGLPTITSTLWPVEETWLDAPPDRDEVKILETLAGMGDEERAEIEDRKQEAKAEAETKRRRPKGSGKKSVYEWYVRFRLGYDKHGLTGWRNRREMVDQGAAKEAILNISEKDWNSASRTWRNHNRPEKNPPEKPVK